MKNTLKQTDEIIVRIRESALFYLKLDFGFVAGLVTLISTTKIELKEALSAAADINIIIQCFIFLIVLALLIELSTTSLRNSISLKTEIKERHLLLIRRIVESFYLIQVMAHIALIGFFAGYLFSYLGHISNG